jgi:4-amino-4-deoxy-L-arabinose transferase-like glycosyltransferase
MFLLAALVRLDDIRTPGHLLDREYTSAIFARAFYFENNPNVETWRQEIATIAKDQQPVLEPPLLEYMVSLIYRLAGREELHYSRYLTGAFWLIGGVFLFLIVRTLLSTGGALIATAYYLFIPMGVIISRSFQPDSLMFLLFLISLYLLIRYFDAPSTALLLSAAIVTAATLLLRPLVIFAIFFAFLALSYQRKGDWKKLIDVPLVVFSAISLLPAVAYYGYGILGAGFMRWKITTSFMPYLLPKPHFWTGWLENVVSVAGLAPLILAILGFLLLKQDRARYLVVSQVAAFLLFSIAFTYHIHTHPYYHIQLIPIVGLCMAAMLLRVVEVVRQAAPRHWWIAVTATVLLALFVSLQQVRASLYTYRLEEPGVAQAVGEAVHHSPHTVYVAYYYGLPLVYYGEFGGAPWPVRIEDSFYRAPGAREQSVEERLAQLPFSPEYFAITDFDQYHRLHPDLQEYLAANCQVEAQTAQYLVYSTCNAPLGSATPSYN